MYSVHVDSDVMVPMRDGVQLAADAYVPAEQSGNRIDGRWPVVLVRTSYNKTSSEWDGVPDWYARRGYVFVIQDLRSRYKSVGDGRYYHTCNPWEGDDGYDTIEWLAAQPWSNGRIGMMGSSHRAIVQTQAALHSPPHLAAICPEQGPTNTYLHEARDGGSLHPGTCRGGGDGLHNRTPSRLAYQSGQVRKPPDLGRQSVTAC